MFLRKFLIYLYFKIKTPLISTIMLVRFTVCNYLSFKEKTSIDFVATSLTEYRNDNIFQSPLSDISLLKSLIIYGANSSGKSNLFKALSFMKRFMLSSSKETTSGDEINIERFKLSTTTAKKPSFFEIEIIVEENKYRYGFEVDTHIVHSEYLYYKKKNKEFLLFERKFQTIDLGKKIDTKSQQLFEITRENALFLSVLAQFNNDISIKIINGIRKVIFIHGLDDFMSSEDTVKLLADKKYAPMVTNLLRSAKLGFNEVKIEKISGEELFNKGNLPKELQKLFLRNSRESNVVSTKHNVYDENNLLVGEKFFDLNSEESLGTKKFFALAGPIITALTYGNVLIIDEFDSRLHPELCKAIIKLFNSEEFNPHNAQLIIASHNSTFINSTNKLFRRDQIIIANKTKFGMTSLESLYGKKVRKDASFEKDYLSGKYEGTNINLIISNQLNLDLFD